MRRCTCAVPLARSGNRWFDATTTGRIGALIGITLGIAGATLGCLATFYVTNSNRRTFVLTTVKAGTVLCAVMLGTGIVAFAAGQPCHVSYTFLITGTILACSTSFFTG